VTAVALLIRNDNGLERLETCLSSAVAAAADNLSKWTAYDVSDVCVMPNQLLDAAR
jgi:hypothetical protein